MRVLPVLAAAVGVAALAAPADARVIGELAQVGFRVQAGYGYRVGEWLPVLVRLRVEGAELFSGTLRFEQTDTDGDRCAVETPVSLTPDSPEAREFWLYCPVSQDERESVTIRLLDDAGNATPIVTDDGTVQMGLTSTYPAVIIESERTLVLDISERAVPGLAGIDGGEQPLMFAPDVGTCAPGRLPDRWYGLEMVDIVVWNRPDVTLLTPDQLDALREWTRRGGLLVLAVGRQTDASKLIGLETVLPAEIAGSYEVGELDDSLAKFFGAESDLVFDPPLTVARLQPKPGAHEAATHEPADGTANPIVVRGRYGFGSVLLVSADLLDIGRVTTPEASRRIYRELLQFRAFPGQPKQSLGLNPTTDLFPYVRSMIDFGVLTSAYLIIAFVFIVAYILGSTVATWHFLQKKNWAHHNWSVFAIAAIVASAISVSAVQAIRGVGASAAQLCIVDAVAGSGEAHGLCYFGLKTSTHAELDVWLPAAHHVDDFDQESACKLKPIPPSLYSIANPFSDPQRYVARPERARLDNVRVRATLKQFEGNWLGQLDGTLAAEIRVVGSAAAQPIGWIENRLSTELEDCVLVITAAVTRMDIQDQSIFVLYLDRLRPGERVDVGRRIAENNAMKDGGIDVEKARLRGRCTHWSRHFTLAGGFGSGSDGPRNVDSDTVTDTLLILSFLNELEPRSVSTEWGSDFARSRLRDIDLSNALTPKQAFVIGFTREPGPARICTRPAGSDRDFRPVNPRSARTMYRFAVPVMSIKSGGDD
jgi:hypothetical protein